MTINLNTDMAMAMDTDMGTGTKVEAKANLADLALYFGTDTCYVLVSDDGSDICVSAGGFPVSGRIEIARIIKGKIVEDSVRADQYVVYDYADSDLALDYYVEDPYRA